MTSSFRKKLSGENAVLRSRKRNQQPQSFIQVVISVIPSNEAGAK
jgi:hypothetical protein